MTSKYFKDNGYCRKHEDYNCEDCLEESQGTTALTLVVADSSVNTLDKAEAYERYKKQTKFIKKALKMDDKKLSSHKLKEVPELMKKAQEEVTIGDMGELLQEEYIPSGFLRNIYQTFARLGTPRRRR